MGWVSGRQEALGVRRGEGVGIVSHPTGKRSFFLPIRSTRLQPVRGLVY